MPVILDDNLIRAVLAEAEAHSGWRGFVEFGRLLVRGLRKPALRQLDLFLNEAEHWSFAARQDFVMWLLTACEDEYEVRRVLMTTPTIQRLVKPTLDEWQRQEPENATLYRWFAAFFYGQQFTTPYGRQMQVSGLDCLRYAVFLAPNDQKNRVALARLLSYGIYLDQHHLPDYYLDTPRETLESADELEQIASGITDVRVRAAFQEEASEGRQQAQDWLAFQTSGESDFAHWCEAHQRRYEWTPAYYYTPKRARAVNS